jgi:peptide chain release factor subunit 1
VFFLSNDYALKKELKRLRSIRGVGTELITIYVPPGFPISEEIGKLREEHSQSGNIKSKSTRLNVQSAIERIIQYLKLYKEVPKNGLAVFCGNVSPEQAKTDIEIFSIDPPLPIKTNMYRCDSTFNLEPLDAIAQAKDTYCLLVMDGRDATIGTLRGTHVEIYKKVHSLAHAHVRKGGQSAARYERMTQEATNDYYKSVGNHINDLFARENFKIKGLIVGGSGPVKEDFLKAKTLNYQIKVLGVFDTGYTDERVGIKELLDKAKDLLQEQEAIQEKLVMERFLGEVAHGRLATYGYRKVHSALMEGNVARLIVSDEIDLFIVKYKCTVCGAELESIEQGNARKSKHGEFAQADETPSCDGPVRVVEAEDAVEVLIDMAERQGIEVSFISSETEYGQQLILGFGGIAAMLKR